MGDVGRVVCSAVRKVQKESQVDRCGYERHLQRWSCDEKELPSVSDVKAIHIYDFDNTLFASPLPNKQLWNSATIGQLGSPDMFLNGGWWHDSSILAATGEGIDKEEARAWQGWWNEQIVELVESSMAQKDALSVLLTGRGESDFADLVKRMPAIGPAGQKFRNTMEFKQELLKDIVYTYKDAEKLNIYEDRVKHTKGFRDFFFQFNEDFAESAEPGVPENATHLDPVAEIAEIQKLINAHNIQVKSGNAPPGTPPYQIKKTVFYTGYMIPSDVTEKLTSLVSLPPGRTERRHPISRQAAGQVEGDRHLLLREQTLAGSRESEAVPKGTKFYSENPVPTVVLAIRKNGRPADAARIVNWHPVPQDQAFEFDSVVGEKQMLRIEEETPNESEYESYFPNKAHRREDQNGRHDNRQNHGRGGRTRRRPGGYRGGNRDRGRGNNRNPSYGRGGAAR
ncbi:unnamed protein product [Alternaria alternata]